MLTKRQFLNYYDEAVSLMKQIKLYNDKLNKKLGVANTSYLLRESEAQSQVVEKMYKKVGEMIDKMQKSYLDPQTARKIGNVKQQLRNQKDRRAQLLENLDEVVKTMRIQKKSPQRPKAKEEIQFQMGQSRYNGEDVHHDYNKFEDGDKWHKRSIITEAETNQNDSQSNSQVMMEISDFDYEMERKLMHQKNQKIGEAHDHMLRIKSMIDQSERMVNSQGEYLDIIGDDLFVSYKNTVSATQELVEASSRHRRFRKKICILIFLCLLAMLATAYVYFYMI